MPRPPKNRFVCNMPKNCVFSPEDGEDCDIIILTVDEYETIRLIDNENLTQEECAAQMQVARTTVQMIYDSARKKIAHAIVDGRRLEIRGGNYTVCGRCKRKSTGICMRRGECPNGGKDEL